MTSFGFEQAECHSCGDIHRSVDIAVHWVTTHTGIFLCNDCLDGFTTQRKKELDEDMEKQEKEVSDDKPKSKPE